MFNEAVGLDPDFARAHAALGRCYVQHAQGYGGAEYFVLAERSLKRALELDPTLVDARLQMVYVDLHHGDKERAHEAIAAAAGGGAPTIPRCCSWRACSTAWTASTSRRSPSTTACWS